MDVISQLKNDIALTKRERDLLVPNWQLNVVERRGKDTDDASDEGRSRVPVDWTVTKTKAAQLFSQMPQVRLSPRHESYADAVPVFAKIINDLLNVANVEAVMAECVVDCINAAGVGAAIVRYETLTDTRPLPKEDPLAAQMMAMAPAPMPAPAAPMGAEEQGEAPAPPAEEVGEVEAAPAAIPATRITARRFCVDRISPADLLWPKTFRSSDWDKSPWLGHSARGPWPKVKRLLGLKDEDKEAVVGAGKLNAKNLASLSEDERVAAAEQVEYDEVFYWRYLYHEDETSYEAIQRVVFVQGLEEPVINEPWTGQKFDPQNGGYMGSCLLPVRVLTLAYISDEAIPPSDSAIIRPMIKELQQSRQDSSDQRKHSKPLRWFDVDKIAPTMAGDLVNGTWQGMIPTIGAGDKAIGEIARAAMPRENLEFDRILKQDIQEAVGVGPNQSNTFASGERSASEAQIVQQSFQTEMGQQRARVASFFVGIAHVLMGLWSVYGVVDPNGIGASLGPDGEKRLAAWDRQRINQKFIADVRADSTVRLDPQQLVQQLTSTLNITAQSGFVNPKPLIRRILEANGVDPMEVLVDPKPKGPEPPKISYAFKGEDLTNPIVLGIIAQSGQAPGPEAMAAADKMLEASIFKQTPPDAGVQVPPPGGAPAEVAGMAKPAETPETNPEIPDKAFPQWESAPRPNTRRAEG